LRHRINYNELVYPDFAGTYNEKLDNFQSHSWEHKTIGQIYGLPEPSKPVMICSVCGIHGGARLAEYPCVDVVNSELPDRITLRQYLDSQRNNLSLGSADSGSQRKKRI
jgi:hypothetical protein